MLFNKQHITSLGPGDGFWTFKLINTITSCTITWPKLPTWWNLQNIERLYQFAFESSTKRTAYEEIQNTCISRKGFKRLKLPATGFTNSKTIANPKDKRWWHCINGQQGQDQRLCDSGEAQTPDSWFWKIFPQPTPSSKEGPLPSSSFKRYDRIQMIQPSTKLMLWKTHQPLHALASAWTHTMRTASKPTYASLRATAWILRKQQAHRVENFVKISQDPVKEALVLK